MKVLAMEREHGARRTVATAVLGMALLAPLAAMAQSASGQSGGAGGGFGGLGGQRSGASGLGLKAGPMGAPSSLGSLTPSTGGFGGQKPGGGMASQPGGKTPPVSGRPAKGDSQSIGDALSAGPYAESRPGGLYGSKKTSKSAADKLKQASAGAGAGVSRQYNYKYGSESLGTNANSIYQSSWKSPTDGYQWGKTTP